MGSFRSCGLIWLWCLLVALGACGETSEGPTELLVVVDADAELRQRIDAIEVTTQHSQKTIALTSGKDHLPLSFSLAGDPGEEKEVTLRALQAGSALIERRARVLLVRGKRLAWHVYLASACTELAARCAQMGQTCGNCAECVAEELTSQDLVRLTNAGDDGTSLPIPSCEGDEPEPGDGDGDGGGDGDGEGGIDASQPDGVVDAGDGDNPIGSDASTSQLTLLAPRVIAAAKGKPTQVKFRVHAPDTASLPAALGLASDLGSVLASDCTSAAPTQLTSSELELCLVYTRPDAQRSQVVNLTASSGEAVVSAAVEFRMPATRVGVGQIFGAAVLEDGTIQAWGSTMDYRVPNAAATARQVMVSPFGFPGSTGVQDVVLGDAFGCGLTKTGGVYCWGNNSDGRLGRGAFSVGEPGWQSVAGLASGASAIAVGAWHGCAIVSGVLKCWGNAENYQLGPSATSNTNSPINITLPSGYVLDVAAGTGHTCAIVGADQNATSGTLYCWGDNVAGQLGIGSTTASAAPMKTTLRDGEGQEVFASRLAGQGYDACAEAAGKLYCWGSNWGGGTGTGAGEGQVLTPKPVDLPGTLRDFVLGGSMGCALVDESVEGKLERHVYCWGETAAGSFADATTRSNTPKYIANAPSDVEQISLGVENSVCALSHGLVYCWGNNHGGELANNADLEDRKIPTRVPALEALGAIEQISLGRGLDVGSCVRTLDDVWCWGEGWFGELGQGLSAWAAASTTPVKVQNLPAGTLQEVKQEGSYACARVSGSLYCWGRSSPGGGTPSVDSVVAAPFELPSALPVTQIEMGAEDDFFCVLQGTAPDAEVSCFPTYGAPQLDVPFASGNISSISRGQGYGCAIVDGGAQCFGDNGHGRLGHAALSAGFSASAVDVDQIGPSDPVTLVALASKSWRTCALTDQGDLWCWGGDEAPARVFTHKDGDLVTALNGHGDNLCYVRTRDGAEELWCDGGNYEGQLISDFKSLNENTPSKFVRLDASGAYLKPPFAWFDSGGVSGREFLCVRDQEGPKCWGDNALRQLGLGPVFTDPVPKPILPWTP
ncbi:MAG: hypothetical protein QM778_34315 [Myxococcales bacterium]